VLHKKLSFTVIEAILALEKMGDCGVEAVDRKEGQCGSEDIHGLICLAAQLAFEVNFFVIVKATKKVSD